jgi:hypothetical protein
MEGGSLAFEDYRINAQVRQLLVRRGIELNRVEHGVTNSVVYLRGTLRSYLTGESDDPSQARLDEMTLVTRLERALRSLPGVRDVVFDLDRLVKVGWRWKPR